MVFCRGSCGNLLLLDHPIVRTETTLIRNLNKAAFDEVLLSCAGCVFDAQNAVAQTTHPAGCDSRIPISPRTVARQPRWP